ncbi:hypothetical protein MMC08_001543 [Hypocenomyce scalaris]|nr:hypothetical protein [Hypocenomyce scalaris]
MPPEPKHVVVLGQTPSPAPPGPIAVLTLPSSAGVIGLQTAVFLLEAGYRVTIVASHVPGDTDGEYASPWAGAHWRTHAAAHEKELCEWDAETYRYWIDVVKQEAADDSAQKPGLSPYTSLHYWASPTSEIAQGASSLWWRTVVQDFAVIEPQELPPNAHTGVRFKTLTINVPLYLSYLLTRFRAFSSARLIKATLPTTLTFFKALAWAHSELLERQDVHAWVNATGLGARELVGDDDMYPVRGQTVLVTGEARGVRTRVGSGKEEIAYVIPRKGSGMTVLGGTKEVGVWNTDPDEETTKKILEGCKDLAPELLDANGEFRVLSALVGLRPARKGGPRVEREVLEGVWLVVHCYGHAGAGYQNSVGSARRAVYLLKEYEAQLSLPAEM